MTDRPVIAVGSVGLNVDVMESFFGGEESRSMIENNPDLLARQFDDGEFDFVAVGRATIGDAEWVSKVRDGRYDEIRSFRTDHLKRLFKEDWDPGFIGEQHLA